MKQTALDRAHYRRLHAYDYSRGGSMFVTISQPRGRQPREGVGYRLQGPDGALIGPPAFATFDDRQPREGAGYRLVGPDVALIGPPTPNANAPAPNVAPQRAYQPGVNPFMGLTNPGQLVERDLLDAAMHFGGFITLRKHVVMPDHVHFRFTWPAGRDDALKLISQFVGRFKQLSQWHVAGHGPKIWQEGYYDLICNSERCNRAVDAYIENNALKWWLMHCDRTLMHVIEPVSIGVGDDLWRGVGNMELLSRPRLVALRVSRRVSAADLDEVAAVCVRGALERGYTYVSTDFSPGEQRVFRALAAAGASMVRLAPTYLQWGYRPHGDEPRLFAERRLLVLSRMPDPAEPPSRGELLALNAIAADLARASEGGKAVYCKIRQPHKGVGSRLQWELS